jgi:predicted restriction endonuclease
VRFDHCKIHHIRWWRNGGRTDLDNLLPVCFRHHDAIHHQGWVVELGPDRVLTLTLPNGEVMTTGPPTRRAA